MEQIKQNSIEHYIRMIKFAEGEILCSGFNIAEMRDKIHETHGGKYCSYCIEYYDNYELRCYRCPLEEDGVYPKGGCCSVYHSKLVNSITWRDWIENAKQVLYYIIVFG